MVDTYDTRFDTKATSAGTSEKLDLASALPDFGHPSSQQLIREARNIPWKIDDGGATVTPYPGNTGAERPLGSHSDIPQFLLDKFDDTHKSRAKENVPATDAEVKQIQQLKQVDQNVIAPVVRWELIGDGDLYRKRDDLGGRDIRPVSDTSAGSSKDPGHLYVVGFNKEGLPVNMLDYYRDNSVGGELRYKGQYTYKYTDLPQMMPNNTRNHGAFQVEVTKYVATGQTAQPGPSAQLGETVNVEQGTSVYWERKAADPLYKCSQLIAANEYYATDKQHPAIALDFSGPNLVVTRNGKQDQYTPDRANIPLQFLAPQFNNFDLFGPPSNVADVCINPTKKQQ